MTAGLAATAVGGALASGLVLLARARLMLIAGLAVLGAAAVAAVLAYGAEVGTLGGLELGLSPATVAAALVSLAALCALAAVLVRFPAAAVPALLVASPLRPPLDPDASSPLLVTLRPDALVGYQLPLYVVLAAATLALAWRILRGEQTAAIPGRLAYPATALIALTCLSLLWSEDPEAGLNDVLLFWLPYTALIAVVARSPFPEWMPRALAAAAVGLACLFAVVGVVQVAVGDVLFGTPALMNANATTGFLRTTSLFQDPSIYGRHLVVGMAVVVVALWFSRLSLRTGTALLALLGAALWFTYSQSSMLALVAAVLAIALMAGDRRTRLLVGGVVAALAVAGTLALGAVLVSGSAADLTRNRSTLVLDSARALAADPLAGVGVGGQPVATRSAAGGEGSLGRNTSHTTPVTVAVELGVLGLAAYAALLAGAVLLLRDLHRRHPATAVALAAVLVALFVHALIYEGFFETATSWGAIALACSALAASRGPAPAGEDLDRATAPVASGPPVAT
jgi:putative inorganic carbon (HCO3(-)) transporter